MSREVRWFAGEKLFAGRLETQVGAAAVVDVREIERPKGQPELIPTEVETPAADRVSVQRFLAAVRRLMSEGCVSDQAFEYRLGVCEGLEGRNPPCPNVREKDGLVYCGGCSCGARRMADLTVRLRMPDPQCPIQAIRPLEGSGSLEPLGGRLGVIKRLTLALADELKRLGGNPGDAARLLTSPNEESR